MSRRREILLLVLLIFAAIAPHLTGLGNDFVLDDEGVIVRNRSVTDGDVGAIWSGPYWPESPQAGLFRPVTSTTYAIDWAIWGDNATGFLVTNLLVHAMATCAALWLVRRLFPKRKRIAWAAAFLFAVHPIHVEAVVGIVGRAECLAAAFAMIAYAVWLSAEERSSPLLWFLAPLIWLLAILSKESAVALPVLLLGHRLRFLPWHRRRPRLRILDILWIVAAGVAVLLRASALGSLRAPVVSRFDNPLAHVGFFERFLSAGGILLRQLRQVATADRFSADYSYAEVEPTIVLMAAGAAAILVLAAAGIATLRWGRGSALGWGFALFFCFWFPTSNLVVPIGTIQADRLLYLPLLGLFVIAAAAYLRIPNRVHLGHLGLALLILLTLRWGIGSALRSTDWKDDRTLFEAAVRDAPMSLRARTNLAAALLREHTPRAARETLLLLEPVREVGSEYGPFLQREAKSRMFLGENKPAIALYRRSLRLGADSAEVLVEIGNLALMADDGAEALAAFRLVERTGRKPVHSLIGRASALSILGRTAEASAVWQPIVRMLPDSVGARLACAWNLRESGSPAQAEALIREGLARRQDPRLWDALARVLILSEERSLEALQAAQQAVSKAPTEDHRTTLALAYLKAGRNDAAREILASLEDPELREEIEDGLGED